MNELALFAGAGGGILGGKLLGWRTVGACEIEEYPREVLLARQRDGGLERFPIWDDVCTFDGRPWRGCVDVVSGGFPCQDISAAGKGAGIEGARSGLWKEMCRIICEVRPRYAFLENSPMLTSRGLGVVLGDLAEAGYDAEWMVLGAADVGAPHRRDRIWILARDRRCEVDTHADGMQCSEQGGEYEGAEGVAGCCADGLDAGGEVDYADGVGWHAQQHAAGEFGEALGAPPEQQSCGAGGGAGVVADADVPGCEEQWRGKPTKEEYQAAECGGWWCVEPGMGRVADGVAHRVDRLKAIGNGQVPLVAATAFYELLRRFEYGAE